MERLGPVFDDSLLARLALRFAALKRPTADSSLFAQLRMLGANPQVDPADTGRVVAHSSAGDFRAADLLASWRRLSPIYRPRVTSAAEVRELVMNGLFEQHPAWGRCEVVCFPPDHDASFADLDHDGDVDAADLAAFLQCITGSGVPLTPGCENADFDGDG